MSPAETIDAARLAVGPAPAHVRMAALFLLVNRTRAEAMEENVARRKRDSKVWHSIPVTHDVTGRRTAKPGSIIPGPKPQSRMARRRP